MVTLTRGLGDGRRYLGGVDVFNTITTYRLTYPECCRLAQRGNWYDLLSASAQVDSLEHYTTRMWEILTGEILQEWFGFRLPRSKLPWGDGPIYLPDDLKLLTCLDRSYARQAKADITQHYLPLNRVPPELSIFRAYGLHIPEDLRREREGLSFIARQADHFCSLNDYLFIVQSVFESYNVDMGQ